jgi:hypothetical protein
LQDLGHRPLCLPGRGHQLGDPPLRLGQQVPGRGDPVVGVAERFGTETDQRPAGRLLGHNPGVILGVGRCRGGVQQFAQIGRAADVLDLLSPLQLLVQGRRVHGLTGVPQVSHGPEDFLVAVGVEALRGDDRGHVVEAPGVA